MRSTEKLINVVLLGFGYLHMDTPVLGDRQRVTISDLYRYWISSREPVKNDRRYRRIERERERELKESVLSE